MPYFDHPRFYPQSIPIDPRRGLFLARPLWDCPVVDGKPTILGKLSPGTPQSSNRPIRPARHGRADTGRWVHPQLEKGCQRGKRHPPHPHRFVTLFTGGRCCCGGNRHPIIARQSFDCSNGFPSASKWGRYRQRRRIPTRVRSIRRDDPANNARKRNGAATGCGRGTGIKKLVTNAVGRTGHPSALRWHPPTAAHPQVRELPLDGFGSNFIKPKESSSSDSTLPAGFPFTSRFPSI